MSELWLGSMFRVRIMVKIMFSVRLMVRLIG